MAILAQVSDVAPGSLVLQLHLAVVKDLAYFYSLKYLTKFNKTTLTLFGANWGCHSLMRHLQPVISKMYSSHIRKKL